MLSRTTNSHWARVQKLMDILYRRYILAKPSKLEGWDVFHASGYGLEIERDDDFDDFETDEDAILAVTQAALKGDKSATHALALHWVQCSQNVLEEERDEEKD